jgi:leucine dehydrogenase
VITPAVAGQLRTFAVCGAANDILSGPEAAAVLQARGILHVPDVLASAGAVIEGIGKSVMRLADCTPLIDRLGQTARTLLAESTRTGRPPVELAAARVRQLLVASSRPAPS